MNPSEPRPSSSTSRRPSRAIPEDYLIRTFLELREIDYKKEVFDKWRRRFNNIVFNNYEAIFEDLSLGIIQTRLMDILSRELEPVRFLSIIVDEGNSGQGVPQPVVVQYFDPTYGIRHRLLGYFYDKTKVQTPTEAKAKAEAEDKMEAKRKTKDSFVKHYESIKDKTVGVCIDHDNIDRGCVQLLTPFSESTRQLPRGEELLHHLFRTLGDHLRNDGDVYVVLECLGETFRTHRNDSSALVRALKEKYEEYKTSNHDILLSVFGRFVVENLEAIVDYFKDFEGLYTWLSYLQDIKGRFFLVFLRELYVLFDAICGFKINSAVVYYFHLKKINDFLLEYKTNNHKTPEAEKLFLSDLEKIQSVFGRYRKYHKKLAVEESLDGVYKKALDTIEPFLKELSYLEDFSWILFRDFGHLEKKAHLSYHHFRNRSTCDETCDELKREIDNLRVSSINFSDTYENLDKAWKRILQEHKQLNLVRELVMFAFSLPSSSQIMRIPMKQLRCTDQIACVKNMIKFNLEDVEDSVVIETLTEEYEGHMDEIKKIILKHQIGMD